MSLSYPLKIRSSYAPEICNSNGGWQVVINDRKVFNVCTPPDSRSKRHVTCSIGLLKLVLNRPEDLKMESQAFFKMNPIPSDKDELTRWFNTIPKTIVDDIYAVSAKRNYFSQAEDYCPPQLSTPCIPRDRMECFIGILKLALKNLSPSSRDFFAKNPIPSDDLFYWCEKIPKSIVEEVFAVAGKYDYYKLSGVC